MLPFNMGVIAAPFSGGPVTSHAPELAPIVRDFDPTVERLSFTFAPDEDNTVFLLDLLDRRGVQVEVGGRVLVTLMGCVAKDIPEGCLTFEVKA